MAAVARVPLSVTREVRDACLCLHLQRAARVVARRFDEAFRPLGLTNQQFSLLMSLNVPAPRRMADVAALLAADRTTLTANLKPLERRRLVTVVVDPADRRGRLLAISAAGRELLARAWPVWKETHREVEKTLAGDADALRTDLRALAGIPEPASA